MKTILFTTHPDQGPTYLLQTDAPDKVISECSFNDAEEAADFLISEGFQAVIVPLVITHIMDMCNGCVDRLI